MKLKRIFNLCLSTAICFILFTGCGNTKSSISADLSYTQSDIGTISVSSDVQIVGLGEASHGVAQYHQMKLGQHRTIAEASAVESPIRQETIGFPAHFFARAHNFKPPGRACQPEADSPMRT